MVEQRSEDRGAWFDLERDQPDQAQHAQVLTYTVNGSIQIERSMYVNFMLREAVKRGEKTHITHWMPLPEPPHG